MRLTDILESEDDEETNKYARNKELSEKFIKAIKNATRGQVDLKGGDAEDMTEEYLFWEPGGHNFGFWCAHGVMKNLGYDFLKDQEDDDKFIEAMKKLGFTTGECLHIIHQRER